MNEIEDLLRKVMLMCLAAIMCSGIFYSTYKHFHPEWDLAVASVQPVMQEPVVAAAAPRPTSEPPQPEGVLAGAGMTIDYRYANYPKILSSR
jgi:hypothetical protein